MTLSQLLAIWPNCESNDIRLPSPSLDDEPDDFPERREAKEFGGLDQPREVKV